jgi:hypothetical protein
VPRRVGYYGRQKAVCELTDIHRLTDWLGRSGFKRTGCKR